MNDEDIITEALERFKLCKDFEQQARQHFLLDTAFYWGDSYNMTQWSSDISQVRLNGQKPCLTVNKTKIHCDQIINDGLQNKPDISVKPTGGGASFEAAQIYESIIKFIQYRSKFDDALSTAYSHAVIGGRGWLRLSTQYVSEDGFEQEIRINRVPDPLSVYLEHTDEYESGDAKFGFVFHDMKRAEFTKLYPKHADAATLTPLGSDEAYHDWRTEKEVRIAEYWRKVTVSDRLHILDDGTTIKESEIDDPDTLAMVKLRSVRSRKIDVPKVEWYKISSDTILDRGEWAGRFIPLIPVYGQQSLVAGVYDFRGHVRSLLDDQRALNIAVSAGMEAVGLQTKVPYLATSEATEGYEEQWARANTANFSVLYWNSYDDVGGRDIPAPVRIEPAIYPQAFLQGIQVHTQNMMLVSGQFESSFGQESNERSRVAIDARQRQAQNATYHFVNNVSKAVRAVGEQLLDLIPRIMDVPQVIKIMAQDGTLATVQIDPNAPQAHQAVPGLDVESFDPQQISAVFNPSVGTYFVQSDVGSSYGTRREEAFNAISQVLQENPNMTPLIGDLWARMSDFPDADLIANRLRNVVPPQALGQGPSPELQQAQQNIAAQHELITAQQQEIFSIRTKALIEEQKQQVSIYEAETDRMKAVGTIDPEAMKPIIRQMVSEALQTHINPLIHAHALEAAVTASAVKQIGQPDETQETPQ